MRAEQYANSCEWCGGSGNGLGQGRVEFKVGRKRSLTVTTFSMNICWDCSHEFKQTFSRDGGQRKLLSDALRVALEEAKGNRGGLF